MSVTGRIATRTVVVRINLFDTFEDCAAKILREASLEPVGADESWIQENADALAVVVQRLFNEMWDHTIVGLKRSGFSFDTTANIREAVLLGAWNEVCSNVGVGQKIVVVFNDRRK